ncbi:MAG: hypothetical protein KKA52_07120 [Candidatus Omnitrophica bacterium]|nr:hypothetical protein [Candidatus Omnitrophota bacterium]
MKSKLKGIKRREECFGSIQVAKDNPKLSQMMTGKSINIKLSFENLLNLRLAFEAAALELNQYHLGQRKAKNIGVNLFLGPQGQITVTIE